MSKDNSRGQVVGCIMFFGALSVIAMSWINIASNRSQITQHPFETLFSDGANLSKFAYTFMPPWTGFEAVVLAVGTIGFILMMRD